ncbi:mechanosensitive ion channel family protein [Trichlorobacter sp.]|uniref:mechanosensitive ion channel family protein n=1 Tax=Trichlorobacter sp. TaxID=2911007 RepID=UPI002A35FD4B|nr:mechanosensitive ion channel family protein [Trichlorobacter sp.]MDY0384956.1 mechanosensitive ion channel family protein [Trichlorobacter sp.]
MAFLEGIYLGNTVQDWLIAIGILVGAFLLLSSVKRVLISRLSRLAAITAHEFDDLLVAVLKNTKTFILFATSTYLATTILTLKPTLTGHGLKLLVLTLLLQGGFWVSAGITFWLERSMQKRMDQDKSSATTLTFLGFLARIALWTIVLLLMLDNLGVNVTGLVAGLGIGGIAVALAVQNILGDLFASLSIVLDKPFVIGDFVVVDTFSGTIEHIGLKSTRIRCLSGEQLIIANNDLLKSRVRNYKRMTERRIAFNLGVTYQTPLEKLSAAKKIVSDIIDRQEHARLDRVHFQAFGDSALNFEVVYFVTDPDYALYMGVQEQINLAIFSSFAQQGIEFAYPTQTLFLQREA